MQIYQSECSKGGSMKTGLEKFQIVFKFHLKLFLMIDLDRLHLNKHVMQVYLMLFIPISAILSHGDDLLSATNIFYAFLANTNKQYKA